MLYPLSVRLVIINQCLINQVAFNALQDITAERPQILTNLPLAHPVITVQLVLNQQTNIHAYLVNINLTLARPFVLIVIRANIVKLKD